MEPLVEVADEIEAQRAVAAGALFVGVNNRNLHDFSVDMTATKRCAMILRGAENPIVVAALSGIRHVHAAERAPLTLSQLG